MTREGEVGQNPLAGRHAVITGGGGGIGASVAASLAALGATVTVMGRSAAVLEVVAAAIGGQAVVVDVAERDSVQRGFASAVERSGPVQILVNNAGMAESAPFSKLSEELWQRTLRVNLDGVFHCSQAVVPGMVEAGWGRIINIASTAGLTGYAYVSAYCAAKHGVVGITRALATELVRQHITVNAICPGYVETDLLQRSIDNIVSKTGVSTGEAIEQLRRVNPQHRFVQPAEVARTVEWLCLPGAESMTGQALALAGGEIL